MQFQQLKATIKTIIVFILMVYCCSLLLGQAPEVIYIPREVIPEEDDHSLTISDDRKELDFSVFESRMTGLWFKRKALLHANRTQDADEQMEEMKAFCQQEGIKAIPFIARSLMVEGSNYFKEGNFKKAKNSYELAKYFNPFSAQPRIELAKTYLKSGDGFFKAARELLASIPIHFRNFWNTFILARDIFLLIITVFFLGFIFFSIFTAVKYNKLLRHEVSENLSGSVSENFLWSAGWIIFFAPLLTVIGAIFIVVYWPIITFRYMNRREKFLFIMLFVFLFLAVPSLTILRSLTEISVDDEMRTIVESLSEEYDPEKIINLREKIKDSPDDPLYHFLIAGQYKKGAYFKEAFDHFQKCVEIDPHLFKALNNIGNIFFRFEQYPQAVVYYRKAIDEKPDYALAYYNMSVAQSENFHFKDADKSLAHALSIDQASIGKLVTRTKGKGRADVLDDSIESSEIWERALAGKSAVIKNLNSEDQQETTLFFFIFSPLSIIALISLFFILFQPFMKKHSVMICSRCGQAFCKRCGIYHERSDHCTQCVHLFIKKDGLEPEAKNRKLLDIARFEGRTGKIKLLSSLFFPGSAQNLDGKIFTSVFITIIWLSGISWIFLKDYFLGSSEMGTQLFTYIAFAFAVCIVILSWLAGNIGLFVRKG